VQIVGKNSVDSHLPDVKGTCTQLSYDVTSENYLRIVANGKQLLYVHYNIRQQRQSISIMKLKLERVQKSNVFLVFGRGYFQFCPLEHVFIYLKKCFLLLLQQQCYTILFNKIKRIKIKRKLELIPKHIIILLH